MINYVRENLSVAKNLAGYLLSDGMRKIAAGRDMAGKLHLHSAVCTHSGCELAWNSTEQRWDCSCHGSHFAPDGTVLNGPAIDPLQPVDAPTGTT
ncbi:Rieske 2Fe-2S domain-containing protein [Rhizobiaceae sp. 2RAB30]